MAHASTPSARVLETARLRLRPFARHDIEVLRVQWTHPDVRRYLWDGLVVSRDQVRAVIDESITSFATRGFGMWAVELRDEGAVGGFAGLRPVPDTTDVELYYGLDRAYWGLGVATEAARAVARFGFLVAGLDQILVRTDGPNRASVAVMERLGAGHLRTDPVGEFGTTIVYVLRRAPG